MVVGKGKAPSTLLLPWKGRRTYSYMRIDAGMVVLMRLMIGTASVAARAHRTKPRSFHGTVSLRILSCPPPPLTKPRSISTQDRSLLLLLLVPNPRFSPPHPRRQTPPPRAMPDRPSPGGGPGTGPPGGGGGGSSRVPSDLPKDPKLWGNFLGIFQGVSSPVVERVKALLTTSSSTESVDLPSVTEKFSASSPMEKKLSVDLPGLALYNAIVQGPSLSRREEAQLLQQLDFVLKQVQCAVRELGLSPIGLSDSDTSIRMVPKMADPRTSFSHWKRSDCRGPSSFGPASDADLLKKEEEKNRKMVRAVQKFSGDVRSFVAVSVQTNHISSEFAQKLQMHFDCLDGNIEKIVRSNGHCFSYNGLVSKLKVPDWVDNFSDKIKFYSFALQQVVTVAECAVDNISTCPGQFSKIGRESGKILDDDFSFNKLKPNTAAHNAVAFAVGAQAAGPDIIKLFMMKLKGESQSVCFRAKSFDTAADAARNAPAAADAAQNAVRNPEKDNEVCSAKFSFDKIYGDGLKCVIEVPYPFFNSKIELVERKPYYAISGDVGLQRAIARQDVLSFYPKLALSVVGGVKSAGFGYQLCFDTQRAQLCQGVGVVVRRDLSAFGVTINPGGTSRVTFCKKFLDSTTSIAGEASYCGEAGEEQGARFCIGIKHAFDPECFVKAKVGTEGVSVALKKGWFAGRCSLKAVASVDMKEWRRPKFGAVLSVRS